MKNLVNELRIGNLIKPIGNFPYWNVTSKDFEYIENNPDEYEPLQITEEFKTKFGNDKLVLVDKSGFVIFKNGYAYQFVFEDYPYVHTIQNLYFDLTNKELICQQQ